MNSVLQARKLGIQINKIAQVSNKMLQFQSSITDQMTASLMIGKQLNFNNARSLFSQGKLVQGNRAILDQLRGINLDNLNVFQASSIQQASGYTMKQLRQIKMTAQLTTKYLNGKTDADKRFYQKHGQNFKI